MPTGTDLGRAVRRGLILVLLWAGGSNAGETGGGVGSLVVLSAPRGRQVWVEGKYAGLSPLQVDSLPAGKTWVEIGGAPGERRWRPTTRIRALIRAGEIDTLRAGSTSAAETSAEAGVASIPPGGEYLEAGGRSMPRAGVMLPAAAVALGVAGFWCRHAADQSYEDYHATLDRGAMRRHYDQAAQLDRAAVACWIGSEACLLSAAWIWLRARPAVPVRASEHRGTLRVGLELPLRLLGASDGALGSQGSATEEAR